MTCRAGGKEGISCNGSLQWAHVVRRGRGLTRWRSDNALLLCAAHHVFYTHNPESWVLFVDSVMGTEAHRALMRDSLADGQIDLEAEWEKAFPNG